MKYCKLKDGKKMSRTIINRELQELRRRIWRLKINKYNAKIKFTIFKLENEEEVEQEGDVRVEKDGEQGLEQ